MVRWLRWHCPPDTEFEIRALAVWGRARYFLVTEAPRNTDFHTWMGKKHFCFFQTAETGNRTPNSGVKGSGANHYPRASALSGGHVVNKYLMILKKMLSPASLGIIKWPTIFFWILSSRISLTSRSIISLVLDPTLYKQESKINILLEAEYEKNQVSQIGSEINNLCKKNV